MKIFENKHLKAFFSVGSLFYLVYIDIYGDSYTNWSLYIAIPMTILMISINIYAGNYDYISLIRTLTLAEKKLENTEKEFNDFKVIALNETNELKKLISKFIEKGMFYSEKLKDILKQRNDFVCIIKSSEGLSDVYKELEKQKKQKMLPFTSVIHNIPGAMRPFERMDVYLVPIDKIPRQKEQSLNKWMENLAEKAKIERERFLADIPSKIAKLAEPFSYKYIAFYISRASLTTGTINRKFNKEFVSSLLFNQSEDEFKRLKSDFTDFIQSKDLALNIEWHQFIKTSDKNELLKKNKSKLSEAFHSAGFNSIFDFVSSNKEIISTPIHKVLKKNLSKKQCENLATKIIDECQNTLRVLRSAGVAV